MPVKVMPSLVALSVGLSLLTGCTSQLYTGYTGTQNWPVERTARPDTSYAVPVYHGWPDHPFEAIGYCHAAPLDAKWQIRNLAKAARQAKANRADGLVFCWDNETDFQPNPTPATRNRSPHHLHALAIKWKSLTEVDEAAHRLEGLRAYLRRADPNWRIESRTELWEMGVAYVAWLGFDINKRSGAVKLEETLKDLMNPSTAEDGQRYLFHAKLPMKVSKELVIAETVYGIGTIQQIGQSVVITSDSTRLNLNFDGHLTEAGVTGNMKVTTSAQVFSGQLSGTLSKDRLQLQLPAPNNSAPVDFIFLR